MTKRKALSRFRDLQKRLGLSHWEIALHFDQEIDGENARVYYSWQYFRARVLLPRDFRTWEELKLVRVLAHELAHLVCRDLEACLVDQEEYLGDGYAQFESRYTHELEGVVDHFSDLLAREWL